MRRAEVKRTKSWPGEPRPTLPRGGFGITSPPRGEVGAQRRVGRSELPTTIQYLALGDSYTIGTGASSESHNYPSLLARRLREATGREVAVTNPAVNGFTTLDLIRHELGYVSKLKPELVSILIGVNDIVQGRTSEQYRSSLIKIYDSVVALKLHGGRVAAISIPDWSVVPAASNFGDPTRLRRTTGAFNDIARHEAMARNFLWVDIQEVSTSSPSTRGWISADDLHPGDVQYAAWANVIWDAVSVQWTALAAGHD